MNRSWLIGLLLAVSPQAPAQDAWQKVEATEDVASLLGTGGPHHNIAFHPIRQRLVMFAGLDLDPTRYQQFPLYRQFWEWTGRTWVGLGNKGEGVGPGGMAWDPYREQMITFGGPGFLVGRDVMLAWEERVRSQMGWRTVEPAAKPPRRLRHTMATDTKRGRVVLFGGLDVAVSGNELQDTWEWDGVNWIERHSLHTPPPRTDHTMAYDASRGRMVMFGGRYGDRIDSFNNPEFLPRTDTWEWDGADWVERISPVTPTVDPTREPRMVYDLTHERIVLVGENEGRLETWEWNGSRWRLEAVADEPDWIRGWGMGYDEARQNIVLFASDSNDYQSTWIYGPPLPAEVNSRKSRSQGSADRGTLAGSSPVVSYGDGSAGSGGIVPVIHTRGGDPYLGNGSFGFELAGAAGGTVCYILGASEPADMGFGGIRFLVDEPTAIRWNFPTGGSPGVPGTGTATLRIAIPDDPSLVGFTSYWQGFVLDPGSPDGLSHTPGLRVTVVR